MTLPVKDTPPKTNTGTGKGFQLPEVSDKNMAIIVLGIVGVAAMYFLKTASVPIITGIVGAVGGFVMGRPANKPDNR